MTVAFSFSLIRISVMPACLQLSCLIISFSRLRLPLCHAFPSYSIAILGDVKADGVVNGQDVGMAYIKTGTSVSDLTIAEKMALDYNMDGYYNMLDVWQIYNNNIN